MSLELERALAEIPVLDVHTHLVGGKLAVRGLHDLLLYHMVVSDLYAAGCPSGARLTQFPGWPSRDEAAARIEEALPFLPLHPEHVFVLGPAESFSGTITGGRLRSNSRTGGSSTTMIRERANDKSWPREVLVRGRHRAHAAPSSPGAGTGRTTTACNTRSNGGSLPAASGANSILRSTSWNVAGGKQPESPAPIGARPESRDRANDQEPG